MIYGRSWVGILIGVGHRTVLIVELVRNCLSVFFLSVHHDFQRPSLDYLKQLLLLNACEVLPCSSIFAKAIFLMEKNRVHQSTMNVVIGKIE